MVLFSLVDYYVLTFITFLFFFSSSPTDEIVKFKLEVKMKSSVLWSGVPYKYCVYTPKTVRGPKDAQYEYIYNTSGAIANRYLTTRGRSKFINDYTWC